MTPAQIVDLYHTREHLHDLGKLLTFMLGDTCAGWLAVRSDEVDADDHRRRRPHLPPDRDQGRERDKALAPADRYESGPAVSTATAARYTLIRPSRTAGSWNRGLHTRSARESLITKADASRRPRTSATANRAAASISLPAKFG